MSSAAGGSNQPDQLEPDANAPLLSASAARSDVPHAPSPANGHGDHHNEGGVSVGSSDKQPADAAGKAPAKKTNLFSVTEDAATKVRTMQGFSRSASGEFLHWSLAVITAFLWLLIARWFPSMGLSTRFKKCSLKTAEFVLVEVDDAKRSTELCPVVKIERSPEFRAARKCRCGPVEPSQMPPLRERMIVFRHKRYVFDEEHGLFEELTYPRSERASVVRTRIMHGKWV